MKIQVVTFPVKTVTGPADCLCTRLVDACCHLPGLVDQRWSVNVAQRTIGGLLRWQDASVYLAGAPQAREAVRGVYPHADLPVGRSITVADLPGYPCAGECVVADPFEVDYADAFEPQHDVSQTGLW
jgi:hypothetical protein